MPRPVRGRALLACVVSLVAAFVFLYPIGSRTHAVRCADGTGCVQVQYRSLSTTAFLAARIDGTLGHLNLLTIGIGLMGTAAAGAGAWRLGGSFERS